MNKRLLAIVFFFAVFTAFAEDPPMRGWEFPSNVTLNGQRFQKPQVAESYREQEGYAVIDGQRIHYWLYDTLSYHGGKAGDIYNRYIPWWIEKMGYSIDHDHIETYDPNPNLSPSVTALMQQRGCDVAVALITDGPIYEYVVINEWFKSKGIYKTTVYPLFDYREENPHKVLTFENFGGRGPRGVIDLGAMSKTQAEQRIDKEFDDFFGRLIWFGGDPWDAWNDLSDEAMSTLYAYIRRTNPRPQGRLFKVGFDTWVASENQRECYVGLVYWGTDDTATYKLCRITVSPVRSERIGAGPVKK